MIKFVIEKYLPLQFKYLALLLAITGLVFLFSGSPGGGVLLLFVATLIYYLYQSIQYKIEIDLTNKTYHDYLGFLSFKSGSKQPFDSIKKVYMTASSVTRTMNQRSITQHLEGLEYSGFLKFADDHKIYLGSSGNAEKMRHRLRDLAKSLNITFDDLTQPD